MAHVFQINVSHGGVPKLAVRQVHISTNGVEGDRQRDLKHHGGPNRAVCLYSVERLMALQAEGHTIFPGAIGENLTISGLDWEALQPGERLQIGDTVLLELTSYTVPCDNLTQYFKDGKFKRVSQQIHPGWSRWYARVVVEGLVQVGNTVEVQR